MTGKVAKIVRDKGFAFIQGEDGVEYFFHRSDFDGFFNDMADDATAGNTISVNFIIVKSAKGPRAGNVSRLDWPNQNPG